MRRAVGWAPLVVVALVAVLGGVAIGRMAQPSSLRPSSSPATRSAVDACSLPSSDPKAGGPLTWTLAVRADSPEQANLLFVSGWVRLLCTADRSPDGSFGSVVTSMGGSPSEAPVGGALTYETGTGPAAGGEYPTLLVVGRLPRGTVRIVVTASDGEHRDATLGDGWYLVSIAAGPSDEPTEITAFDAAGKVIARLANPDGVQPGGSASAAAS